MSRRWRHLIAPRGRFWGPLASPVPAVPPPQWMRQAGPLRFGAKLITPHGRRFDPAWPQANQGIAHQQFLRQAGPSPRYGPLLYRSAPRRFNLPYPATVAVIPVVGGNQLTAGRTMLKKQLFYADI